MRPLDRGRFSAKVAVSYAAGEAKTLALVPMYLSNKINVALTLILLTSFVS